MSKLFVILDICAQMIKNVKEVFITSINLLNTSQASGKVKCSTHTYDYEM
jgi:hypothetical protein